MDGGVIRGGGKGGGSRRGRVFVSRCVQVDIWVGSEGGWAAMRKCTPDINDIITIKFINCV